MIDINIKVFKNNQHGFTLIEIMIAMVVFAIGILAVAAMQTSAIKCNSRASGLTEATIVADSRMEQFMTLDYNDPVLNDTDGDGVGGLNDATIASSDGSSVYAAQSGLVYNIFWNIAINSPVLNTKQIRLIVNWTEHGKARSLTFNFIKAETQ